LGIPVAGNGDIADAESLVRRAGGPCDAVMVGRAAVRQPWIFARARRLLDAAPRCLSPVSIPIPDSLILDTGIRFIGLLARWQPPEFHISRDRRFFGFFCDNLKWGNYLKNLLNREETLSGIERVWREHFHSPVPDP
jgi:tRNA-dihydrouridine synthase